MEPDNFRLADDRGVIAWWIEKGRHPIQDAGRCGTADFSYGVISNTTPQPPVQAEPVPPALVVPYRLPLLSNTRLL